MIAFSLALLCITPLIKQPIHFYKEEIEQLENLEIERLASWSFTEIKELFISKKIPWKKIPQKDQTSEFFSLPPLLLEIPHCKKKKVQRKFYLKCTRQKIGSKEEDFRQIEIYLYLNNKLKKFRTILGKEALNH